MLKIRQVIINNKMRKQFKLNLNLYLIILPQKFKIIAKEF